MTNARWGDPISSFLRLTSSCYILFWRQFWWLTSLWDYRGKFRSETSGNMDRWKRRGWKSQRRERVRRKKTQAREKVEKSRNTVFVQCSVAPAGLAEVARSHLGGWEMKNCTALWREARLEVKMIPPKKNPLQNLTRSRLAQSFFCGRWFGILNHPQAVFWFCRGTFSGSF